MDAATVFAYLCLLQVTLAMQIPAATTQSLDEYDLEEQVADHNMLVERMKHANFSKEEKLLLFSVNGYTAGVKSLIDLGVNIEAKGKEKTALHYAAQGGHVGVVRVLLDSGASVNAIDGRNDTPLHLAASQGQLEVCRLLVQGKADLELRNKGGETALLSAAGAAGHTDVFSFLIAAGAQVNALDKFNNTALHLAAMGGHTDMCRLLLNSGAQVNQLNESEATALHLASMLGTLSTVKLLVQFHADTTLKDAMFVQTPLELARTFERTEIAQYLQEVSANN